MEMQWAQRRWTCHHVDIPAIRGTFSGAVAGSLQCLPGSIISPASHSLKMSYIHSNELGERAIPKLPCCSAHINPKAQTLQLESLYSLTVADIKIGIMRKCPQVRTYIKEVEGGGG